MGMRSRGIEIAIEELVLHGLDPSDRDGIREIIQRELERLFREHGVPESLGDGSNVARLEHAGIEVPAGSRADAIGAQVARSLYQQVAGSFPSAATGSSIRETRKSSPKRQLA